MSKVEEAGGAESVVDARGAASAPGVRAATGGAKGNAGTPMIEERPTVGEAKADCSADKTELDSGAVGLTAADAAAVVPLEAKTGGGTTLATEEEEEPAEKGRRIRMMIGKRIRGQIQEYDPVKTLDFGTVLLF